LEETKASLESKIREQIGREMQEKEAKDHQLKSTLAQQEAQQRKEEEERKKYDEQKKIQEAAKAKVNQEIMQGMERLRLEKEKQSRTPPPSPSPSHGTPAPHPVAGPGDGISQEALEDPFIRQTLADIYAKQGLYVEALKIYERILNEEPNNEDVREKLRDILRLKGM
jgi:tetratricopeptide (TPR) repeat protein